MPVRDRGTYHMKGHVTVCTDDTFRKLLNIVMPVINETAPLGKIFFPPLPRYVCCCSNIEHCPNVKNLDHADSTAEGGACQKGNNETLVDGRVERPLGR